MKKQLPTQTALVQVYPCKQYDFLYVIKNVNTDTWLPRIPIACVRDSIKTKGLYTIMYRLYKKDGYDAIFIANAQKLVTEK